MATPEERHPEIFKPINWESCRGKKRTVPMECLCLGFNRTGTATMCCALEILGVPCWHSVQFMSSRFSDLKMWQEAVDRKFFNKGPKFGRPEFDQLLHDFGAVSSDTPAIAFAEDLIEAYPEAKVVLVHRDIDSWYESWMNSVIKSTFDPVISVIYHIERFFVHPLGKIHRSSLDGWAGIRNKEDARLKSKAKFREHYALVRRVTPKDRLLEFNLSEGWEPLCQFLGKPIPDVPFPHVNEKKYFDEMVNLFLMRALRSLARKLFIYLGPVIVAGVGYYAYSRLEGRTRP
ncbi:efflux pump antibiotic resistance protein [Penicillium macrosclerotiorum]|uniref:efflux pump antibiotic resistance protein n=1 Tax=Penicillium macrosclerotiorum TaxID=303699 RepID=UPI00254935A9|nr:efflux pump antibiotic resistance protein [Penicillium macrosclerotiorum]KAJ5676146.1 efflux pump antibiotic resistance protein [Penicillium macrosclerotiorum]